MPHRGQEGSGKRSQKGGSESQAKHAGGRETEMKSRDQRDERRAPEREPHGKR